MSRAFFFPVLAMLALSGCSAGPFATRGSGAQADLATQTACRQRVNEVYDERNRGEIFAPNSTTSSPFSSNSDVGVPSRGLSQQFAYGKMQGDCERDSGTDAAQPFPAPTGRR